METANVQKIFSRIRLSENFTLMNILKFKAIKKAITAKHIEVAKKKEEPKKEKEEVKEESKEEVKETEVKVSEEEFNTWIGTLNEEQ